MYPTRFQDAPPGLSLATRFDDWTALEMCNIRGSKRGDEIIAHPFDFNVTRVNAAL